ncbi:MAG: CoA-binding protein [Nitrososphaerales archaeon]
MSSKDYSLFKTLDKLTKPRSVAIIGASEKPRSWGYMVTKNLLEASYQGEIFPLNPKLSTLFGKAVHANLDKLGKTPDVALVLVPKQRVFEVLEDCSKSGIEIAVVFSSGFSEIGEEGAPYEEELSGLAKRLRIRLVGPNCNGFFNASTRFNATEIKSRFIKEGPMVLLSQSGFVGRSMTIWGAKMGLNIGQFVALGNECDLTVNDFLKYYGQEPSVKGIGIYLEGLKDGKEFMRTAREVAKEKIIVSLRAGRFAAGARAALSHTSKIAGNTDVYEGMLRQIGIPSVDSPEHLLSATHSLIDLPLLKGPRIGILTMGGGYGVLLSDALSRVGLEVPELSQDIKSTIRRVVTETRASVKNPIDLGATWPLDLLLVLKVSEILLSSKEVDGLVIHDLIDAIDTTLWSGSEGIKVPTEKLDELCLLSNKFDKPLLICSPIRSMEMERSDLVQRRVLLRLDDVAEALGCSLQRGSFQERENRAKI